ncbi:MAG: APC family permease [Paludibacteraceae bacterium]|nr:APC family permease [Paludibacteraceae bacterium]
MEKNEKQGFKKTLRPIDVWGLALGAIIGWGCFVLPGNAFLPKAGPGGMALGMLMGGLLILVISISYGYLIRRFPVSGGEFVYAGTAFGKTHAFLCGWFLVLAYWSLVPLNGTALALISRFLFPGIIQVGKLYEVAGWEVYMGEVLVASFFLILLAILNIRGVKSAGWTQTTIALGLVSTILLLTALILMGGVKWANLNPLFQSGQPWYTSVLAIVAMAPWAFIGFDCVPQAAEEYNFSHNKSRNLMIAAIAAGAVLYICVNTITAVGLKPWQELLNDKPFWATGLVVEERLGAIGLIILGLSMFCAVVSGINAFFISTSRLMYAMAQEKALPAIFGKLHKKYATPVPAIIFVLLLALVAPWFGREVLGWIVDMTSVGGAIGFLYTCASAAVISYRKKEHSYTVAGVIGAIISFCFLLLLFIPGSPGFLYKQAFYCLGVWVLLGIVFYIVIYPKYIKEK